MSGEKTVRKQVLTWYTLEDKKPSEGCLLIATFKNTLREFKVGIVNDGEMWAGYIVDSEPCDEIELCEYIGSIEMIKEWAYLE